MTLLTRKTFINTKEHYDIHSRHGVPVGIIHHSCISCHSCAISVLETGYIFLGRVMSRDNVKARMHSLHDECRCMKRKERNQIPYDGLLSFDLFALPPFSTFPTTSTTSPRLRRHTTSITRNRTYLKLPSQCLSCSAVVPVSLWSCDEINRLTF